MSEFILLLTLLINESGVLPVVVALPDALNIFVIHMADFFIEVCFFQLTLQLCPFVAKEMESV